MLLHVPSAILHPVQNWFLLQLRLDESYADIVDKTKLEMIAVNISTSFYYWTAGIMSDHSESICFGFEWHFTVLVAMRETDIEEISHFELSEFLIAVNSQRSKRLFHLK